MINTVQDLLLDKSPSHTGAVMMEWDRSVIEAAQVMAAHDVGAVVVIAQGELVGMLSEREVTRLVAAAQGLDNTPIGWLARKRHVFVSPHTPVDVVCETMRRAQVRHLPVIEDGRVCGVVSIGDVLRSVVRELDSELVELTAYIHGPSARPEPHPTASAVLWDYASGEATP